jgi:hypothetical protein
MPFFGGAELTVRPGVANAGLGECAQTSMDHDDDEVLAFVRTSIISVSALELLLLLRDGRPRKIGELVRELRSSELAVARGLASLQNSHLVKHEGSGCYTYGPDSSALERNADAVAQLYAAKPLSVIGAIFDAPEEKLRIFAKSFRLKE